jgi:two-component system phosphate regulon response regulator OmpR
MENNKIHILIVDDDDRIRSLLKDYLSEKNYIVSTAENADQAKKKLDYFKFDILILDVMMPGQNGYELTKEIKQNIEVPIILLTAKGEVENRIKGLELGADDYIGKPFEPKELLLRINNITKNNKSLKLKSNYKVGDANIDLNKMISIDVMITRLRQKLEINPKNPKYLQTIRGSGYVLWIE